MKERQLQYKNDTVPLHELRNKVVPHRTCEKLFGAGSHCDSVVVIRLLSSL